MTSPLHTPHDETRELLASLTRVLLAEESRSTLLSFPINSKSVIRIVDESLDEIYERLSNYRSCVLNPVREPRDSEKIINENNRKTSPDAKVILRNDGRDPSYELRGSSDAPAHNDSKLETMLYETALVNRCKSLNQRNNFAEKERGYNILYLSIGCLEWFREAGDNPIKKCAPLLTIPVSITKKSYLRQSDKFEIKMTDDIKDNPVLREKLKEEFGITLPKIKSEESPSKYLRRCRTNLSQKIHNANWNVKNYVTLAIFDYSKQAISRDLDPTQWASEGILEHDTLQSILKSGDDASNNDSFASPCEAYDIDSACDQFPEGWDDSELSCSEKAMAVLDYYPIVFDSDSTQHSALIDAVEGKNLVVHGPPGTGKSQTISNMIAALIRNNKKVLFVAEKKAALEVVKGRMSKAGLGDFCLELHSNKADKDYLVNSLTKRLNGKYPEPKHIAMIRDNVADDIARLNEYADMLHEEWKSTKLTIYDILSSRTGMRETYPEADEAVTYDGDANHNSQHKSVDDNSSYLKLENDSIIYALNQTAEQIARLSKKIYQESGFTISEHPWRGLISPEENNVVVDKIRLFNDSTSALHDLITTENLLQYGCDSPKGLLVFAKAYEDAPNISDYGIESLVNYEAWKSNKDDLLPLKRDLMEVEQRLQSDWWLKFKLINSSFAKLQIVQRYAEYAAEKFGKSCSLPGLTSSNAAIHELIDQISAVKGPVEKILSSLGQRELCQFKPDRQEIADLLKFLELLKCAPRLQKGSYRDIFKDDEINHFFKKLEGRLQNLEILKSRIGDLFCLDYEDDYQELFAAFSTFNLGGFVVKYFDNDWRQARKLLEAKLQGDGKMKGEAKDSFSAFLKFKKEIESFNKDVYNHPFCDLIEYEGITEDWLSEGFLSAYQDLASWYRKVKSAFDWGQFASKKDKAFSDVITTLDRDDLEDISHYAESEGLREKLGDLEKAMNFHWFVDKLDCAELDAQDLVSELEIVQQQVSLSEDIHDFFDDKSTCLSVMKDIAKIKSLQEKFARMKQSTAVSLLAAADASFVLDEEDHVAAALELVQKWISLFADTNKLSTNTQSLLNDFKYFEDDAHHKAFRGIGKRILYCYKEFRNSKGGLDSIVDWDAWLTVHSGSTKETSFTEVIERNNRALGNLESLPPMLTFLQACSSLDRNYSNRIMVSGNPIDRAIMIGQISSKDIAITVKYGIYLALTTEVIRLHPNLSTFDKTLHEDIIERFTGKDKELLVESAKDVAYKANKSWKGALNNSAEVRGANHRLVSEKTGRHLIGHVIEKPKARVTRRQLLDRSEHAIREMFPCIMMSPTTVATLLKRETNQFDVLIIDEASQIKPASAIGAIARCESTVIVGDAKQLPPTSFFENLIKDEDLQDDTVTDSESVLELAQSTFESRHLGWHYRSCHEDLIKFSNHNYYDNNLTIFPFASPNTPGYGIKYHYIDDAVYKQGDANNEIEATRLIDNLVTSVLRHPDESFGVVAMNAKQRSLLDTLFDKRIRECSEADFKKLNDLRQREHENIFMKNLESVQGDERDVIYISMTYGCTHGSDVLNQRFGPIGGDNGWRRLNVLFSRARKRMEVYSSMRSVQITNTSVRGVRNLKDWLAYCETGGQLPAQYDNNKAQAPETNEFEDAICEAIRQKGYQCQQQVGVNNYWIDIGVRDPKDPTRFILAVECDGATYHSSKSARDRDRLRQQILEKYGWEFKRVWSTHWFKNPQDAIKPVIDRLEEITQTGFNNT